MGDASAVMSLRLPAHAQHSMGRLEQAAWRQREGEGGIGVAASDVTDPHLGPSRARLPHVRGAALPGPGCLPAGSAAGAGGKATGRLAGGLVAGGGMGHGTNERAATAAGRTCAEQPAPHRRLHHRVRIGLAGRIVDDLQIIVVIVVVVVFICSDHMRATAPVRSALGLPIPSAQPSRPVLPPRPHDPAPHRLQSTDIETARARAGVRRLQHPTRWPAPGSPSAEAGASASCRGSSALGDAAAWSGLHAAACKPSSAAPAAAAARASKRSRSDGPGGTAAAADPTPAAARAAPAGSVSVAAACCSSLALSCSKVMGAAGGGGLRCLDLRVGGGGGGPAGLQGETWAAGLCGDRAAPAARHGPAAAPAGSR